MADKKHKRPVISSPIGPIKSSRGPDLCRSGKFHVVGGIDDCQAGADPDSPDGARTVTESGMSTAPTGLQSPAAVAGSPASVRAPAAAAAAGPASELRPSPSSFLRRSSLPSLGRAKTSRAFLPMSATASALPANKPLGGAAGAATPPSTAAAAASSSQRPGPQVARPASKLPRSRTLGVLRDLKRSVSRPGLAVQTPRPAPPRPPPLPPPGSPEAAAATPAALPPDQPVASAPSGDAVGSAASSPEPHEPRVTTAQPMEYWTGRFSRLNDLYMSDDRAPETLLSLRSGLLSQHHHRHQSVSPQSVTEDDARHLHIFAQLDFLCFTPEAKLSLRDFQQAFARRLNRSVLLPDGATLGHSGLLARLFASRRRPGRLRGHLLPPRKTSAHACSLPG